MGEWRIEIRRFFRHPALRFKLVGVTYLTHQIHPVGYHDEDHAHVFGKGDEKIAEILTLHDGILSVEFLYAC